jgi:acetoin utilization protein AcuB
MKLTELRVANYMTPNPITVEPEDSLMRALEVVRLRKVRRLPVTIGGELVGLVTAGDLKRAEPSTLTDSQERFNEVMEETQVARIMVQNPVTTTPETPLVEAAHVLQTTKYGGLPVVTGGHLVGMITDNDLLRALVDILRAAAKAPQPTGGAVA